MNHISLAYMNIRGQTGLDECKQVQIENFLKSYKIDILNCQEINVNDDSFNNCGFINSSYSIISNNAQNKYGTCCFVSNCFNFENVKFDTKGRIIVFDIGDITFSNVYLPSGSDATMKNDRENYIAETLPQMLINSKNFGCTGGDWNCIAEVRDSTKNANCKVSNSLKRLIKTFGWVDSFRQLYPNSSEYSRYYDNKVHGSGASRIDRMYYHGHLKILEAYYVGIAFSDHFALIVKIGLPQNMSRLSSPKARPLFKSKPDVIRDPIFKEILRKQAAVWLNVKETTNLDILVWWDLIVKPNIRKLLIERSRQISKENFGKLNMLQIHQAYLVKKVQSGLLHKLSELHFVQAQIVQWHKSACEKVKIQAKCDELNSAESVRIYHHELHKKQIQKKSILKLETDNGILDGHDACAKFLENQVANLLLNPAQLDCQAQYQLLQEISPVFTKEDNEMLIKEPSKSEVKLSIAKSNLNAAPGTDSITSYFYYECWEIIGDSITEVTQAIYNGRSPTKSQRTSLMVFGSKPKKPNSVKPADKRKISLLNADFKIITGITNERLKSIANRTLSPCQLAMGSNRRIHHGINQARDAIIAAGQRNDCVGILDNDYMAAFDYMVLKWVLKVLRAKGMCKEAIQHIENLYKNNLTIVVVNNILGRKIPNNRWSIRQGDRPSSLLFCHGIDPHLSWLDSRLKGIQIYSTPVCGPVYPSDQFPLTISESFKVIGYIDDVKPAVTSLEELLLIDKGSSLFEAASGCKLHRNPSSGKVKLLPLGKWRNSLKMEDLPVNYVAISDHLDMVGVTLKANYTLTRQINGDQLVERVSKTIGPWKGGRFMPLTLRCHSVNTYCFSKLWFKCGSIDLRQGDIAKITSLAKSWVYADLLIKPEETTLFRVRSEGGLSLLHVKYRALAELIKSFIDTAKNPKFLCNIYHNALYEWNVADNTSMNDPGKSPFYSAAFFEAIKVVKLNEPLQVHQLSTGMWYRALLKHFVLTEKDENEFVFDILPKVQLRNPFVDWQVTWSYLCNPALGSQESSFLFRWIHNLLPTQQILAKVLRSQHSSQLCSLCDLQVVGDLLHSTFRCSFNSGVDRWLISSLQKVWPNLEDKDLLYLRFSTDRPTDALAASWLTSWFLRQFG